MYSLSPAELPTRAERTRTVVNGRERHSVKGNLFSRRQTAMLVCVHFRARRLLSLATPCPTPVGKATARQSVPIDENVITQQFGASLCRGKRASQSGVVTSRCVPSACLLSRPKGDCARSMRECRLLSRSQKMKNGARLRCREDTPTRFSISFCRHCLCVHGAPTQSLSLPLTVTSIQGSISIARGEIYQTRLK